ncbi:MAG: maltotriose-and DNA-dependent transcriptional regulator MalT [Rhodoglobus sp.]|nr:maltotriose-and DNA-dependent transcriptional regulator MalT [Rhodoglobus sp.]
MPHVASRIVMIPSIPTAIIPRAPLVRQLQDDVERHRLTIVRAPSGAGKSTLLATWAVTQSRSGVWVSLSAASSRRIGFWEEVLDAIRDAGYAPSGSVLADSIPSVEFAASLHSVLERGFASLPERFVLVIDDFHEVTDELVSDDLHRLLRSGLDLTVVIATRADTGLEDPLRVAQVDTAVLSTTALEFTVDDVAEVASLLDVGADAAPEIHGAFSGWPLASRAALLQLAAGHAETPADAIARVVAAGGGFVIDDSDEDYLLFLLRLSVASRASRGFVSQIPGGAALEHLARAEGDGLGTWLSRKTDNEFALHPFVRQQLERVLHERLPDEVRGLRAAYARDREDHRDAYQAAVAYSALGDLAAIVRLVRRYWTDLMLTHEGRVSDLLRSADQAELRQHPELLVVLMLSDYAKPSAPPFGLVRLASLAMGVIPARLGVGDPVERVSLLSSLLAAQRSSGHFEQAAKTAQQIEVTASALGPEGRDALEGTLPSVWIQIATTRYYTGDLVGAEAAFATGLEIARQHNRPWSETHASSMLTLVLATSGDLTGARPRLEADRRRSRPQGWQGTYTAAGHHLARAYDALERFEGSAARDELELLRAHEPTIEHWPVIAHLRALSYLVEGNPEEGLASLAGDVAAHADRPSISSAMSGVLAADRADLLLAAGFHGQASDALARAPRTVHTDLAKARVHLLGGRRDRALALARSIVGSGRPPRIEAQAMLVVAVAAHRLGQSQDAASMLERAAGMMQAKGLRLPLLGIPLGDLRAIAEEAGLALPLLDGVPDIHPSEAERPRLTAAEARMIAALDRTGRVDELAADLHVSANTVKTHLRRIYRKLGATNRQEALGIARLHGLLQSPDS